jgi:5-methylcytosine-specific restriction enzyme A
MDAVQMLGRLAALVRMGELTPERRQEALELVANLGEFFDAPPGPAPLGLVAAVPRDPRWESASRLWLRGKACSACGSGKPSLVAHHVKPFHLFPELEMEPENWIALCERPARNCHLVFGHLLDWAAYNPMVRQDAASYNVKVARRPYDRG